MKTYELPCTYGASKNKSIVYVYENNNGSKWYAVDGSVNVNLTFDEMNDGVDVEELNDVDCFTSPHKILSWWGLINAVEN